MRRVLGVVNGLQELRVSVGAAAILWWAGALPTQTARVLRAGIGRYHRLRTTSCTQPSPKSYSYLAAWPGSERWWITGISQPGSVSRPDFELVIGYSHNDRSSDAGLRKGELVEVGICPAHCVLDCHMQIPVVVVLGNLKASPHWGLNLEQSDFEL